MLREVGEVVKTKNPLVQRLRILAILIVKSMNDRYKEHPCQIPSKEQNIKAEKRTQTLPPHPHLLTNTSHTHSNTWNQPSHTVS